MTNAWRFLAVAFPALLGTACASGGASSGTPSDAPVNLPTVRESGSDYVTATEIAATPVSNAYDLVNRLRPRWLQAGRPGSISGGRVQNQVILVYLDGTRIGTTDALRSLSIGGFKSMQYYDAIRAATVLRDPGTDPIAGAIAITTTRTP
jgi:hypothetical protein